MSGRSTTELPLAPLTITSSEMSSVKFWNSNILKTKIDLIYRFGYQQQHIRFATNSRHCLKNNGPPIPTVIYWRWYIANTITEAVHCSRPRFCILRSQNEPRSERMQDSAIIEFLSLYLNFSAFLKPASCRGVTLMLVSLIPFYGSIKLYIFNPEPLFFFPHFRSICPSHTWQWSAVFFFSSYFFLIISGLGSIIERSEFTTQL